MTFTKDQKTEAYKKLPEEKKEYLASDDFTRAISEIAVSNNIKPEQITLFGDIMFMYLIKLIDQKTFSAELSTNFGQTILTEPLIKKINEDVEKGTGDLLGEKREQKLEPETKTPNQTPFIKKPDQEEHNREKILSEIEDPDHATETPKKDNAGMIPPNLPTGIPPATDETRRLESTQRDQLTSKLTGTLRSTPATIPEKKPEPSQYQAPRPEQRPQTPGSPAQQPPRPQVNPVRGETGANNPGNNGQPSKITIPDQKQNNIPSNGVNVPKYGGTDPYRESME